VHVACCSHDLVDLVEQLRGKQSDVVFEGLEVVGRLIKRGVSKHRFWMTRMEVISLWKRGHFWSLRFTFW
jgi:hypothetical protein